MGVQIDRNWIYMLDDGTPVFDWGDGCAQNLLSGEFIRCQSQDFQYAIRDDELEMLRRAGRVEYFDKRQVSISHLPEPPRQMLD